MRGRVRDRREIDEDNDAVPRRNGEDRLHLRTLDDLDGRTAAAKRARRLVAELQSDLGRDPSAAEAELIQRAAVLGAILEDAETRWLEQRRVDLAVYGQLICRQRRVLETLGLGRTPRNVTPGNGRDLTERVVAALRVGP